MGATLCSDPVALGLVASLARPGGNATGVTTSVGPEIGSKRLELLKEIAPRIKRVAYLGPWTTATEIVRKDAARLGLTLIVAEIERVEQWDEALAAVSREHADALLVSGFAAAREHAPRVVAFAAQHRLPAAYAFPESVEAGGLVSYSIDFLDLNRRAAVYVDRILRGAKPADLPVEQPTRFELNLNLKTARALSITIPQSVLLRADRLIE